MPTLPAEPFTAEMASGGPSGSLSAPEPLSANRLPPTIVPNSVMVKASGCATGASSIAVMFTVVVATALSIVPSLTVTVIVRAGSVPPTVGSWLVVA